jgi:hypothetical protein
VDADKFRARERAYWNHLTAIVGRHGHAVQFVFPTEEADPVCFAYTVGLQRLYGAELLVFGLRSESAMALLNNVSGQVKKFGALPPLGVRVPPPPPEAFTPKAGRLSLARLESHASPGNVPVVYRRCTSASVRDYVPLADRFYGQPVDVVQVVLPDAAGRFPEDDDYDAKMTAAQPVFYSPGGPPCE